MKTLRELQDYLVGPGVQVSNLVSPGESPEITESVAFYSESVESHAVTLEEIQREAAQLGHLKPEWADKMLHRIPDARVLDRVKFVSQRCKARRVLNLGSDSGGLHEQIKAVAMSVTGVDRESTADFVCDLDKEPDNLFRCLNSKKPFEVIVAGEIIEHLRNPGRLLDSLKLLMKPETCLIVTVPNVTGRAYQKHAGRMHEIVNGEHVAWYSWLTLTNLLEYSGLHVREKYWYNGKPFTAEGLIFVATLPPDIPCAAS